MGSICILTTSFPLLLFPGSEIYIHPFAVHVDERPRRDTHVPSSKLFRRLNIIAGIRRRELWSKLCKQYAIMLITDQILGLHSTCLLVRKQGRHVGARAKQTAL